MRAKKLLSVMKKSPIDMASQYLSKVILHTQDILERRLGSAFKDMNRKFVLTVPAVWSDKAKDSTLKVAISAGIPEHQLALLSEPEAAALYTLRKIQPNTIKVRILAMPYTYLQFLILSMKHRKVIHSSSVTPAEEQLYGFLFNQEIISADFFFIGFDIISCPRSISSDPGRSG